MTGAASTVWSLTSSSNGGFQPTRSSVSPTGNNGPALPNAITPFPNAYITDVCPLSDAKFGEDKILDDPVEMSNERGTVSFATSGPNARGSQMFVNLGDNAQLDEQGFAPFAVVS